MRTTTETEEAMLDTRRGVTTLTQSLMAIIVMMTTYLPKAADSAAKALFHAVNSMNNLRELNLPNMRGQVTDGRKPLNTWNQATMARAALEDWARTRFQWLNTKVTCNMCGIDGVSNTQECTNRSEHLGSKRHDYATNEMVSIAGNHKGSSPNHIWASIQAADPEAWALMKTNINSYQWRNSAVGRWDNSTV